MVNLADASTIAKIYGPSQTGVQLGKWQLTSANDDITLSKISFTLVNPADGVTLSTSGDFGTLSLYDGGVSPIATASYVSGDVVFSGFSSTVAINTNKTYTLKGNINDSGNMSSGQAVAFVVKSDANSDMEARSAAGSLLGTADINENANSNAGSAETKIATSTKYMFHDAYPTVATLSADTSLKTDSAAKVFRFTVTNGGSRPLNFTSTSLYLASSGIVGIGQITTFKLYDDNGSGSPVNLLSTGSSLTITSSSPTGTTHLSGFTQTVTINAASSRTFIVTADTSAVVSTKTAGTISLSPSVTGTTGMGTSAWNTGNFFYTYTPTGGTLTSASASDSYNMAGPTLSLTL